jgi:NADH-quinone oxidoreductase subunit G
MPTIYVENEPFEVPEHQNMLHACLSLGFDLPYFCWHPGMHSVGACRQCAVKQFKDEKDEKGKIVMACMLHATDGTRISIRDPEASEFRAAVIELLMTNHPHDCPVCDEGGECHLQDMTVMSGHNYRRYRFHKRTHRSQYLGPFVHHEMNRCIACYRCLRFYREYAGGRDLEVLQWHNDVYFGRHQDGVLQSEFSGNLVEVCPTGVFTDKTLKRHYTRKWDLQTGPSVCVHCGVGCNTLPGERYGTLRRILNRYNGQVNGYWLCDRGRFGYEFVNDAARIRQPRIRAQGAAGAEVLTPAEALDRAAGLLRRRDRILGIGSPRASLEANFALRTLVGAERFYCGMSDQDCRDIAGILEILRKGPARSPALADVARADATLVLGEDVTQSAPITALAIRQASLEKEIGLAHALHIPAWHDAAVREAIQQQRGPLFVATPAATRVDDLATRVYRAAPDDVARLGFAVAHAIDPGAPSPEDLPEETVRLAEAIAQTLRQAERPLVVSGASLSSSEVLQAAANVAWALRRTKGRGDLSFVVRECNSLGVGLMGGCGVGVARDALRRGEADTVIVLENDLYRRAGAATIDALFDAAAHVIALDHLENPTTRRAEIVLPAATFAESAGTLVNNEGRAQRFFQVMPPHDNVRESWRWLRDLMGAAGFEDSRGWQSLDDVTAALAEALPVFGPVPHVAPPAGFRVVHAKVPRQPHRYSGRTAMHAQVDVSEPKPPDDPDSPLAFSMEGYPGPPPAPLISRYWAPGWNSVQALNKFQEEVGGPLRGGDPGVRLIEPAAEGDTPYFDDLPAPFEPHDHRWLVVPIYHIFGSEELSRLAPGIAELAPEPYLALNPNDLQRLGAGEGARIAMETNGTRAELPVRVEASLPNGVAGLPPGLPETASVSLPGWFHLANASNP